MKKQLMILFLASIFAIVGCIKNKWIISDGYSKPISDKGAGNTDTIGSPTDDRLLARVRVFPGFVCSEEPRINVEKKFEFNFYINRKFSAGSPITPQFSTGLYAAPGEWIVIEVPAGINSLTAQIGIWRDELSQAVAVRDPIVYQKYKLLSGSNRIRSIYGGNIYIIPEQPIKEKVQLHFANVVKSSDYILGESNKENWLEDIKNSCVPWVEMRAKNIIFTLPRELILSRGGDIDPDLVLKTWDGIYENMFQFIGVGSDSQAVLTQRHLNISYRIVMDVYPAGGTAHSGSPLVLTYSDDWFEAIINPYNIIYGNVNWRLFHLISENFISKRNSWHPSFFQETIHDLFPLYLAYQYQDINPGLWPVRGEFEHSVTRALEFATKVDIGKSFKTYYSQSVQAGDNNSIIVLLQIIQYLNTHRLFAEQGTGWGLVEELFKRLRQGYFDNRFFDQDKVNGIYSTICDYTKRNWEYYFRAWGIKASEYESSIIRAKYPDLEKDIEDFHPFTLKGADANFKLHSKKWWEIVYVDDNYRDNGYEISPQAALIDADLNTKWTCGWSLTTTSKTSDNNRAFPHVIIVDFSRIVPIKGFVIYQNETNYERIKTFRLESSSDGKKFAAIEGSPFTLKNNSQRQEASFKGTKNIKYIKITVSGAGDTYNTTGVTNEKRKVSIVDLDFLYGN